MTNYDFERSRLEMNARFFQPDPQLDRAADLFHTDRAAWDKLPAQLRSQSSIYADFREYYRAAVKAGVIKADRGSAA